MDITKLTRTSHRKDRPGLRVLDRFDLAGARTHEACGPARRRFALWLARSHRAEVMWIKSEWHPDVLHMQGLQPEVDPARLLFVECNRPSDILWTMEEALRSGLVKLVIADLAEPPGLTPVRRLHLAAEAGFEAAGDAPLGLLLTPGDGGAAGVETRWHLRPDHRMDMDRWQLARLRARTAPVAGWAVTRGASGLAEISDTRSLEPA